MYDLHSNRTFFSLNEILTGLKNSEFELTACPTKNPADKLFSKLIYLSLQEVTPYQAILWQPDQSEYEKFTQKNDYNSNKITFMSHIPSIKAYNSFYFENKNVLLNGFYDIPEGYYCFSQLPEKYKMNFLQTKIPCRYIEFENQTDYEFNINLLKSINDTFLT